MRPCRRRRPRRALNPEPRLRSAGFSLLEVLLAMVVLAVAIVGIAQGFAVGLRATGIARGTTTALALARARLDEIDAGLRPTSVSDKGDFQDLGAPDATWTLTSTPSKEHPGLYELVLKVEWPDRGGTRDLTIVRWMLDRQAGATGASGGTGGTPK